MSRWHGNSIPIDNSTRISHKIRAVDEVVVVCLPGTQKYLLFIATHWQTPPRRSAACYHHTRLDSIGNNADRVDSAKNATIITLQRIGKYTYYMINWPSIIRAIYNVTDGDHQYTKYWKSQPLLPKIFLYNNNNTICIFCSCGPPNTTNFKHQQQTDNRLYYWEDWLWMICRDVRTNETGLMTNEMRLWLLCL